MAWQEMVAEKGGLKKWQSPPLSKAQPLSGASHKRKGNQKIVKKRILDIHGREARVRPRHY